MPERSFTKVWDECFDRLPEFPNLNSVSLIFDRHGANEEEYSYDDEGILQSRSARREWLEKTLKLMGPRIKHLGLRHYQDVTKAPWLGTSCCVTHRTAAAAEESNCAFAKSNSLREFVLRGLESLQMIMVHEQPMGESGTLLEVNSFHLSVMHRLREQDHGYSRRLATISSPMADACIPKPKEARTVLRCCRWVVAKTGSSGCALPSA